MSESSNVEDTIVVVEVLFELTETDAAERHRLELKASAVRQRPAQPKSLPNGRADALSGSSGVNPVGRLQILFNPLLAGPHLGSND